jgi:hypothetical protein
VKTAVIGVIHRLISAKWIYYGVNNKTGENNMVYVMCFTDATQRGNYELSTMEPEEWVKQNPTLHLVYAFKKSDELLYGSQCERDDFMTYCGNYGFEQSDYERKFKTRNGNTLMLIGFYPQNRKYKCRLINTDTGEPVKATVAYVQQWMKMRPVIN